MAPEGAHIAGREIELLLRCLFPRNRSNYETLRDQRASRRGFLYIRPGIAFNKHTVGPLSNQFTPRPAVKSSMLACFR
jgi:hypothetical protein